MRETSITEEELEFMDLRDQILEVIPQGKENSKKWMKFRKYMDFYYKNLPSVK